MSRKSKPQNGIQELLAQIEDFRSNETLGSGEHTAIHIQENGLSKDVIERIQEQSAQVAAQAKGLQNTPQQVQQSCLIRLEEALSMLDMTVRENILGQRDMGYSDREERLSKQSNILVSEPPRAILRVTLPPLIGRKIKGSYNIYWKLKMVLSQYERTHKIPEIRQEKMLLIYKVYARNLDIGYVCDNDNWEMQRTTNAICEALQYSDNPSHFSMFYTAVHSTVNCVEATVIYQKDLQYFLNYLSENTPEYLAEKQSK